MMATTKRVQWRPISIAVCGLLLVEALAFAAASTIHFGAVLAIGPMTIHDSFPGAAIPEAVIAIVLGIGFLSVLARWPARWIVALVAALFTALLTIYGLTVTVGSARTGDIAYHIAVLALAGVLIVLLLLPAARRGLAG